MEDMMSTAWSATKFGWVMGAGAAIFASAGLALPAEAQTRSQAPARAPLRLPAAEPVPQATGATIVQTPLPGQIQSPRPVGSGVRATFPGPIRPGETRLRLPPAPPVQPPVQPPVVGPQPPFWWAPALRPRREVVVVQPYPHYQYYTEGTQLVVGTPGYQSAPSSLVPAASVEPPQPPPMTKRELGDAYLYWDEPDQAIAAYQDHLSEKPEDMAALRMLGLALIDGGRLQEGIATIGLAYERDPQLAGLPLPDQLFGSTDDLRRNLTRVSVHANRVNTASAWLTLALLMQIERRPIPAARMLERAEQAGLSPEVVGPMRAALGRR
jgi:hypothetical protein